MEQLVRFLATPLGRVSRVVIGILLFIGGIKIVGMANTFAMIVGGVLALSGILNVCGIAVFTDLPVRGKDLPPIEPPH